MVIMYDMMKVLANPMLGNHFAIQKCIKPIHCITKTYRMLNVNYINKDGKNKREF